MRRSLGGRSRRSRGCAGVGEGGIEGVVHGFIIAENQLLAVGFQFRCEVAEDRGVLVASGQTQWNLY